jgi:hypothetical protein
MNKQLLFYERAVPVSKDKHRGFAIASEGRFGFASEVNAVPVVVGEFARLSREYPIVFVKNGEQYSPVALCGLRDSENLFVEQDGAWSADYIPAFVRRYPFVFHQRDEEFVLCVDEAFEGLNKDGSGQSLFGEDGEASDYLEQILGFATSYQKEVQITSRFSEKLASLGLLEPASISFKIEGKQAQTQGIHSVSEDALKALPAEELHALANSGELKAIYTHILSLQTVELFSQRMNKRLASAA